MHHLIIITLALLLNSVSVSAFIVEPPYLLGTYLLRKTNDISFESKYTYLDINENNIKLKTIYKNWVIATKKSRGGSVSIKKPRFEPLKTINKWINKQSFDPDNDVELFLRFNSINKYTYSLFGIEFPEIKYEQITNYNLEKNIRVRVKGTTLYVTDDFNNYYIFDIYPTNTLNLRLPYVETAIYTLLFTEILGSAINLELMKIFKNF